MAISWTDVTAVAPELASTSTTTQNMILALVERWVSSDSRAWGSLADDGKRYLAAHLGTLVGNKSGAISSESLGPMSRSYSGGGGYPPGVIGSLALSNYGAQFKFFLDSIVPRFAVVP